MTALLKSIDGIPRGFDYSALPADVAGEAQRIAIAVRARHKDQIKAVVDTGRDLATVKAKLAHGQFTPWLDAEFGWSERTAQNYIAAAATFEGKTAIVADLPLTAVYALSAPSTPEPVRAEILQRRAAGEKVNADDEEAEARRTALDRLAVLIVQPIGDNLGMLIALAEQAHEQALVQAIRAVKR